jgi:SAM-dependent methyltransferase
VSGTTEPPDYLAVNRATWTRTNLEYADAKADLNWAETEIAWGLWKVPERELKALPDLAGKDVIELGCGTAYFGAWLKRNGARRLVGVDITPAQLTTARRLNLSYGLGLELIECNAESVPLPDSSFDLAVSEYGASIWCDPQKWIPEAARLLRPSGELVFLRSSTLSVLCMTESNGAVERLVRPQRGLGRIDWGGERPAVEFNLGHGELFRVIRDSGFELLDLIEVFAPESATDHGFYSDISAEWARQWPSEEIWRARKR